MPSEPLHQPLYVVFAGVNGAGKSTFYRTGFWRTPDVPSNLVRVNPDEIVVAGGGDPLSPSDQLRAAREALRRIDDCLERRKGFNQETTLTGRSCLKVIERARDAGYRVVLYYVGVASPETALDRVAHRVSVGGHPIDEATVRRRYVASLRNLSRAVALCDEATVLDNTVEFAVLAQWTRGVLSWIGDVVKRGSWLMDAIRNDDVWRGSLT